MATPSALLSIHNNGLGWFQGERTGDLSLYTTTATDARVLIGGGSNAGQRAALEIGVHDVGVQGVASAALFTGYGLTLTLPPGATLLPGGDPDAMGAIDPLLANANIPSSNPYVWASNAAVAAKTSADAALAMAAFSCNALYDFSNIPDALGSVAWSSNQINGLLDARHASLQALIAADHASNTSIVALRRADLSSNAAYTALAVTTSIQSAVASSNADTSNAASASLVAATSASNASAAASNLAFRYLPHAADTAFWASNVAAKGASEALYSSNIMGDVVTEVQIAGDKATSAYITAASAASTASWSSNAAARATREAVAAINASVSNLSSQSLLNSATYASNLATDLNQRVCAVSANVAAMSNTVYPTRAQAGYGSNLAALSMITSTSASNAAAAAAAMAAIALSNSDRALSSAMNGISIVGGTLDLQNKAALVGATRVGVGTLDPQYPLHVASTCAGDDVSIWVAGNIQQMSDLRNKADIEPIESALDKLTRIHGYTYRRLDGSGAKSGGRFAGVMAQEVQRALPEAVHAHPETHQLSVSYHSLIPLIIEAIHELTALVGVARVSGPGGGVG
jgi:hypothetical protein